MRWFGGIVVVLIVLVAAFLYGGLGRETWTSRFRIGVEVDTPNGLKTGSSVIEVRTERDSGFLVPYEARGARSRIRGEAVFVDLGPGKDGKPQNLITLLAFGKNDENPNFAFLIARAFFNVNPHQGTMGFGGYAARLEDLPVGTRAVLKPSNMPTLVSFADLSDPKSARVLPGDPRQVSETDFASVFREGYQLKRIWIERTDAAPSYKIQERLSEILRQISKYDAMVVDPRDYRKFRPSTGNFIIK